MKYATNIPSSCPSHQKQEKSEQLSQEEPVGNVIPKCDVGGSLRQAENISKKLRETY